MKDLWRENLRQLFLDFIDLGEDEEAWKINLGIYDDLLAEVKELQAWKMFVCDLVKQQDGPHLREMLKELIE